MKSVADSIDDAAKDKNDDPVKWPASLSGEIKVYEVGISEALPDSKERNMINEENADAISRNTKSAALAEKNEENTKERGTENLKVKQSLIW